MGTKDTATKKVEKAEVTCILCNIKVETHVGGILCEECLYNVESDYEAKCL